MYKRQAYNGFQAIEKIKEQVFDLVFMDLKMPEMDGFQATALIREMELPTHLPVIALTAAALTEDLEKFKQNGMDGHLLKPFNPQEIKDLLLNIFENTAKK